MFEGVSSKHCKVQSKGFFSVTVGCNEGLLEDALVLKRVPGDSDGVTGEYKRQGDNSETPRGVPVYQMAAVVWVAVGFKGSKGGIFIFRG